MKNSKAMLDRRKIANVRNKKEKQIEKLKLKLMNKTKQEQSSKSVECNEKLKTNKRRYTACDTFHTYGNSFVYSSLTDLWVSKCEIVNL